MKKILLLFPFRAEAAGITIFQEIGLDPGIDHLLAMNCFDSVKESGGKVHTYLLPASGVRNFFILSAKIVYAVKLKSYFYSNDSSLKSAQTQL